MAIQGMKNTLDTFAPIAAAGFMGYQVYKKEPDNYQKLAIYIIGAYLIVKFIMPKVTTELVQLEVKPKEVPPSAGAAPITEKVKNLCRRVYEDISCTFCTRETELYDEIALLTDGDLIAMNNYWLQSYYSYDKETLVEAIDREYMWWYPGTNAKRQSIVERLRALT